MASRRHTEIRKTPDGRLLVSDLGSSNGTFVNGNRISKPTPLSSGSRIMVGHHVLSWDGQARNLSNEVAVIGHGVAFDYQSGKRALHSAFIEIQSGVMTAIMGPSGCGKSTLLKILNGEMLPTEGRVEIFGLDLVEDNEYLRTVIGYVPQDDIVHPELTVEQAINFAARLRLDGRSSEEISRRVEEVIADLKITHIRGNRVSNISGGQRKRVCIAVELLSSPLMLFLDEPTSPLDPQVIEDFLGILKNLVRKGTTVVMVTHKPEDLAFMENVIFMAEGGHLAFAGPARAHLDHFGASRTTEVYASLAGAEAARHAEGYRQARPPGGSGTKAPNVKLKLLQVNQARQFFWLVMRFLTIKTNDKWNTAILLVQAPLVAGLICLIFQQIVAPVLFLTVISMVWFGTNNSAREIVGERSVFRRERMFNLRILPYYASKLLVLGILGFIQAILFVAVITAGYAIREANPGFTNPAGAVLWLTGVCLVGTTMGLLVSASMNNIEKVMSVVPLVLIPQIMLAGFIATISNGLVEALSFLMIARWANEGLTNIQEEVVGLGLNGLPGIVDGLQELLPKFGENYRELFGDAAGTLPLDLWFLVALATAMAVATLMLIRKN
jgi:ABC-type multidrug transport system ATPase subunit